MTTQTPKTIEFSHPSSSGTEPTTIISVDFSASQESRRPEPTHFSCECEACRAAEKTTSDWSNSGPLPEAA